MMSSLKQAIGATIILGILAICYNLIAESPALLSIPLMMLPSLAAWAGYFGVRRGDDKKVIYIAQNVFVFNWICIFALTDVARNISTFEEAIVYTLLLFGSPLIVYLLNKEKVLMYFDPF